MIQRQPAWYCVRTLRWREELAYGSLRQFREMEAFFPRLRSLTVISGQSEPSVEPLFAGHLFAFFPMGLFYRRVRHSPGVKGIVSFMGAWPSVSDADMMELRRAFGPREIMDRPTRRLEPGTMIDVRSGPLRGFRSVIYYDMPASQRVNLLTQLLRRSLDAGH
jgi:transcription antitermination factor NusG